MEIKSVPFWLPMAGVLIFLLILLVLVRTPKGVRFRDKYGEVIGLLYGVMFGFEAYKTFMTGQLHQKIGLIVVFMFFMGGSFFRAWRRKDNKL